MSQTSSYRFGPLEQRGFLIIRIGQWAVIGVGLLTALMLAGHFQGPAGIVGAAGVLTTAGAVVFWPIEGLTIEQWTPLAVRYLRRRVNGRHRYVTTAPLTGLRSDSDDPSRIPGPLRGLTVISADAEPGQRGIGVIKDARRGAYTALLAVRGRSFALLDDSEKARVIDAWSGILAGYGHQGALVRRLQWVDRTVPDDGEGVATYLRDHISERMDSPPVRSYLALLDSASPVTQQHESFLAVQIDARRAGAHREIREAGGGDLDLGACLVLLRELNSLAGQLPLADIVVEGALTSGLISKVIRVAFDPGFRHSLALGASVGGSDLLEPRNASPTAAFEWPRIFESDGYVHCTYHVAQWPRRDVGPSFFAPLILKTRCMRTVSMTLEPVPELEALRQVERTRTSDESDNDLRGRTGWRLSASKRREQENAIRAEEELAEGHTAYRFSAYVTVTARDLRELAAARAEVVREAGRSSLVLQPLVYQQAAAFTYTLPLCRGLR